MDKQWLFSNKIPPVFDIVEEVLVHGKCRTFSLKFENDESLVVSRSEQVLGGVRGQNPESLLPPESLDHIPAVHVPQLYGVVLTGREEDVLARVEYYAVYVTVVSPARVHFPGSVVSHAPQLNLQKNHG